MSKSTGVTGKGQAAIPDELREKYDLKPGQLPTAEAVGLLVDSRSADT